MTKLLRKLTALLFLLALPLYAAPLHIDYYGVVSQSEDANILKMAQDIFLTQLKSMQRVTVDDCRADAATAMRSLPDFSTTTSPHLAFYAEIAEEAGADGKEWLCTFTVLNPDDGKCFSRTERYTSYYKILVNAKLAIEGVLDGIGGDESDDRQRQAEAALAAAQARPSIGGVKVDSLAGTWSGESELDKIILLRGGKGFVIFKNGASMNIRVSVTAVDAAGNIAALDVTQESKPNASFYPMLPREVALAAAATAGPIVWSFTVGDDGALRGTKRTLVQSAESSTGAEQAFVDAVWTRR